MTRPDPTRPADFLFWWPGPTRPDTRMDPTRGQLWILHGIEFPVAARPSEITHANRCTAFTYFLLTSK